MKSLINRLKGHRTANYWLVSLFFVFILAMHDPFVQLSVFVMNKLTPFTYDRVVAWISVMVLLALVIYFFKKIIQIPEKRMVRIFYFLASVALIFGHTQLFFVLNIEIIHAAQFALLALLVFPLTGNFGATVYWCTLLGMADELFQYLILYPEKSDYYDFNDIILDQLGAGLAVSLLFVAGIKNKVASGKWYRSPVILSWATLLFSVVLLCHWDYIVAYAPDAVEHTLMVFNKAEGPEAFWRNPPDTTIKFHITTPLEGAIILTLLTLFYFGMDKCSLRGNG